SRNGGAGSGCAGCPRRPPCGRPGGSSARGATRPRGCRSASRPGRASPRSVSMAGGRIPAETAAMDPIKGAVAGAVGGAAGAYTMERFQDWWNGAEQRLAPKRRAHAAKDTAEKTDEPATVKVADRISKKTVDTPVPDEYKPAAGEAVHYTTGAT